MSFAAAKRSHSKSTKGLVRLMFLGTFVWWVVDLAGVAAGQESYGAAILAMAPHVWPFCAFWTISALLSRIPGVWEDEGA